MLKANGDVSTTYTRSQPFDPFFDGESPWVEHQVVRNTARPERGNDKPAVRRRGSGPEDGGSNEAGNRKRHTRSRTEVDVTAASSSNSHHPLRSAGLGLTFEDTGVTRPHLSRLLKDMEGEDRPQPVRRAHSNEEKEVLVHEVTSSDSLAGVSLKYGISLADLRRANQLWASDSIHLRKVLFIPIDKAARAAEFKPQEDLISWTPEISMAEHENIPDKQSVLSIDSGKDPSQEDTGTLRKIPVSRMSFFPPPTSSKRPPMLPFSSSDSTGLPTHGGTKQLPNQPRYNSSPASNSLTSILTALPISASTRDDIIARLSFDSVSSSYSDRELERGLDPGHELEDVKTVKRRGDGKAAQHDSRRYQTVHSTSAAARRPPRPSINQLASSGFSPPSSSQSSYNVAGGRKRQQRALDDASLPLAYLAPPPIPVRTVQLEPSPEMRLPIRSQTVKNQATQEHSQRESLLDLTFDESS